MAAGTALLYLYLVALLRLTGNRTLAQLRAFDFIVVVAIGSVLAATAVSPQTPLLHGVLAITTLVLLQVAVAGLSLRSPRVNALVTSPPTLLYYDGRFLQANLRRARVSADEVRLAMRGGGFGSEGEVWAVVLETNGRLAVVGRGEGPAPPAAEGSALANVEPPGEG